jgi:8-oxo-dGTP pyrophosphatase MutT (NUDIX family)
VFQGSQGKEGKKVETYSVESIIPAYRGFVKVDCAIVSVTEDGLPPRRIRIDQAVMPTTVTALVVNENDGIVWLARQFRLAANGWLDALPGGYVSADETPLEAMVRELQEEMGLDVDPEKLIQIAEFYSSPGWTDEYNVVFYCPIEVMPDQSHLYGLMEENEIIQLVPVPKVEFMASAIAGKLRSAKLVIAGLWLSTHWEEIRE